jgi:hypothetical protein
VDRIWRSEENEKRDGSKLSRAEVALAFTKEDESGLGEAGPRGMLIFVWRVKLFTATASGPGRGVDKGQGGSFQAIGPVNTLPCLLCGPCARLEGQGAA